MSLPSRTRSAPGAALRLVFDGPLRTGTAPDIAIDALAVLRSRGYEASLSFVSTDDADAPVRSDLRARARALHVEEHVNFGVARDETDGFDTAIVLHRWGGETLEPALRAMRAGVPIVAFGQGRERRFLQEHQLAACARSCSGRDVASAIGDLARDELGKRRLVVKAREFAARTGKTLEPA